MIFKNSLHFQFHHTLYSILSHFLFFFFLIYSPYNFSINTDSWSPKILYALRFFHPTSRLTLFQSPKKYILDITFSIKKVPAHQNSFIFPASSILVHNIRSRTWYYFSVEAISSYVSRWFRRRQPREMWSRTRFLLLAWMIALLAGVQLSNGSQRPRLGGAVNIFSRYGYLSISMRVVPRNDTDTWIFREPTLDVFRNPTPITTKQRQQAAVFDGDFHMEFCDNVRQLLQAYFRDFKFERLESPWRAFSASWSKAAIARHLGINSSFITGEHCYVLVRVARFRENQKLAVTADSMILDEAVLRETENVTVGDTASVVRFIKHFGSHYIAAYVTGNSLYQVKMFMFTVLAYSNYY